MISEELRSRMRRLFFAEHWKVGTICAELGVHHDTVSHAIEASRFINVKYRAQDSVLEPYKSFIQLTLKDHPKLLATRLFDMITPRGYAGSVVQLRRYVRAIRPPAHQEAFFRLRTLPGEQAQVDWGCFGSILIGKAKRALSCFVMVLGWSRAVFACFTLDQTLESFVRCHVRAFEWLGGVPRALLYDNLKTAVLERQGDSHPLPSTPARAGGPLPLRHQAVRALPGRREGDWTWPTKIDRERVERALTVDFIAEARNIVLVAPQGLAKTMIAQNLAYQAILKGHSVLFITAAQLLLDLGSQESSRTLDRRLKHYAKISLLALNEVGYLAFDNRNADLLFQVVSRRYEKKSLVLTTNLAFVDWPTIFPSATCATALIDRVIHHADVIAIEGESYRLREARERAGQRPLSSVVVEGPSKPRKR